MSVQVQDQADGIHSHQQKIGRAFDRQESASGYIDTMSALEVLDSSSDSSLKLNNSFARVCGLVVDDDFKVHAFSFHDALDSA